jgi:hypothetical protein
VLRKPSIPDPPTQDELLLAIAFFEELTGIKARLAYTPMGPIGHLEDFVEARAQWAGWKDGHEVTFESGTGRVVERR